MTLTKKMWSSATTKGSWGNLGRGLKSIFAAFGTVGTLALDITKDQVLVMGVILAGVAIAGVVLGALGVIENAFENAFNS